MSSNHTTTAEQLAATNTDAVQATSEYGVLRRVAMRYAGDTIPTVEGPSTDPVLARQKTTSSWSDYAPTTVRAQQNVLCDLLRERGTEVVVLPNVDGCYAQHYPRDIGFVIDTVLFAARLNSQHRLPETHALSDLPVASGSRATLAAGTIEGGDVMLHDDDVLVGLSEESSADGAQALQDALTRHGINREVVPVHFAGPGIVHLDDHFNIVAPGLALIHRPAFTEDQLRWFAAHLDELIPVTDDEALSVRVNVLAIAPGVVVADEGSHRLNDQLAAHGIEVLTVDYSEVTRIPGSLRCTTLPLLRT